MTNLVIAALQSLYQVELTSESRACDEPSELRTVPTLRFDIKVGICILFTNTEVRENNDHTV